MSIERLRSIKYAAITIAVCSLFIPATAHGYATNYDYAVQAKWTNNLNFMICLSSIEGKEYEELFIKAVDEWKEKWDHFGYTISGGSGCHINVSIVKTYSMLTEHGYAGYTYMEYWEHGSITKADIILPTHTKIISSSEVKGKTVKTELEVPMSKTLFYRAALHEFGHALNLGHFEDNGIEPFDIMYPYPAHDDQQQGISQRDTEALNWLYLGFFEQEVGVRTDKKSYTSGETVKVSGKVSPVMREQSVRIQVLDPEKKLYASENARLSSSGTFSYELKIPNELGKSGTFTVKASYYNMIADAYFDINSPIRQVAEVGLVAAPEIKNVAKITVSDALIVNQLGAKVASIQPYEQVFIRSLLSNAADQTEVSYIVQIKNPEGYTEEISSATYSLVTGSSTFSQSWLPSDPGKYSIEVFLWKNISYPEPLIDEPVDLQISVV